MGTNAKKITKSERVYQRTFDLVNKIVAERKPEGKITKPDVYANAVQREWLWLKQWEEMNPVQAAKILCEEAMKSKTEQKQLLQKLLRILIEMEAIEQTLNLQ